MFCKNCGKEIEGSAKFCQSCGAPTSAEVNDQVRNLEGPIKYERTSKTKTAPKKKGKWIIIVGVVAVIFIVALMGGDQNSESDPNQPPPASSSSFFQGSQPDASNLTDTDNNNPGGPKINLSVEDFCQALNNNLAEFDLEYEYEAVADLSSYDGTTIQIIITENVAYVAYFDAETELIDSLIMIGTGDGTLESGMLIMAAMSSTIAVCAPTVPLSETGSIVLDLLDGATYTYDNLNFTVTQSEEFGTWLIIS